MVQKPSFSFFILITFACSHPTSPSEPLPNHVVDLTEPQQCRAIHARSWGISLACCSTKAPLPDHCKFNTPHMCKFPHCSCTVIVDVDNVQCSDEAPQREWRDHETSPDDEPFQCRNPNFPNEHGEFVMTLHVRSRPLIKPFLLGLSKYRIPELTLISPWATLTRDGEAQLAPDDLFDYFRVLRSLRVFGVTNETVPSGSMRARSQLPSSLGGIDRLEMLSLVNLTSLKQLPEKVDFTPSLRYLLIQNCPSLAKLPEWLSDLSSLSYVKITRTAVQNISAISTLTGLKYLYLPQNKILDISSIAFDSENLQEVDLSSNEICCIGSTTFSRLVNLKYLDLSDNPLKRLPSGGFSSLHNLQWLYLRHKLPVGGSKKKFTQTSLEALTPDVLVGLKRLEYLSLENNPNVLVHHQAFASLASLKSLDLSYCNLSTLPESVVHLCNLKYVWLKFNRFRSTSSIHPATYSMLPLREMNSFDLTENSLTQNPYALFLTPRENTALMESIVSSLKHQPLWWHDPCARRHWRMRLVLTNPNRTSQAFYAGLLGTDEDGDGSSSLSSSSTTVDDESQCDASYKKIIRELEPFETLKDSTTCSRLNEQRRLNRRFRQQLFAVRSNNSKQIVKGIPTANSTNSNNDVACRHQQVPGGQREENKSPINHPGDHEDPVQRAFENAKHDGEASELDDGKFSPTIDRGESSFGDEDHFLPPLPDENCSHLYSTIDVFGYVLAANFVVLICVSLSCIVLLCKRRRRAVESASP